MEVKAKANFVRMSPRKIRLVADIVRGMETKKALAQLTFVNKKAKHPLAKLIHSAVANAVNNFNLSEDNLYIKELKINEGPTVHRWTPKAFGRATPIRKKSSHLDLVLAEIKESGPKTGRKPALAEPLKLSQRPAEAEGVKIKSAQEEKDKKVKPEEEKEKEIIDPRAGGRGGHVKIEGGSGRGFAGKIFRRKSG